MRAWLPLLSPAWLVLACRSEPDDADAAVDSLAAAWCQMQARCVDACPTFTTDRDACQLQAATQFSPGPVAADTFDLVFSPDCFDRVRVALDELSCDERERPWAWAERVCPVWHGTSEVGEECRPFDFPEQFAFVSTCRPGLTCAIDPQTGDDAWRCRDVTDDPGEGEGCLRYQGASVFEDRCAADLRCEQGVCTSGPLPGETCECGGLFGCEGCVDGYCDAEAGDPSGTCQPFIAAGEACDTTMQCEFICDPSTMRCVAPDAPGPLACALAQQI